MTTNATSPARTAAPTGHGTPQGAARAHDRLRVALLGPLEVTAPDGELYVPQGRPRALLAALALRPGRTVPTGELVAALWDGPPPDDAHARVRACARRLCAALDPGGTGRRFVHETGGGYQLSARDVDVDADTFSSLLAQAAGARERHIERALLDRALALWRGAPLSGVVGSPLHRAAVPTLHSLHEARRRAVRRRTDLAPRPHPRGRPSVGPGCRLPPEDALPGTPRPDEGALREELDALFAPGPGGTRRDVVVLHGAEGTGKTTLAVRWAHGARALFPDGMFHLDLGGSGSGAVLPGTASGTLLTALGLGVHQLPASTTARRALLRSALAGRRALLVLDDAASAAQVRCLLPGPGPRVLVTSRLPLDGLPGAGSVPLPLSDPAVVPTAPAVRCRTGHAPLA